MTRPSLRRGPAAVEEVVAARPELVWDLVADVTRVGGWSPEWLRV